MICPCGREFKPNKNHIKNGRGIHCSKSCYYKFGNFKQLIKYCYCGKEIKVYPSRLKLGRGKYCSKKCSDPFTLLDGIKGKKTRWKKNDPRIKRGKDHYAWLGGIYQTNKELRKSPQYKRWHRAVLKRDNYICQFCKQRGRKLNVDHRKPFALYPTLRFNLDNGQTLCISCHLLKTTAERRVSNSLAIK